MSKSFMLIDGNSLGHAAANAPKLSVDGNNVHAIFHTLKMIRTAMKEHGQEYKTPIVLWDGSEYWRKEILPEYKEKSANTPKAIKSNEEAMLISADYKLQRPHLIRAIRMLGITQVIGKRYEADDIAGYMSRLYSSQGHKVLLVTGDKDWLQLINRYVKWYDPIRKRSCDRSTFIEFTNFRTPEDFLNGKALIGDTGDNIKGIDGIGEKSAPQIIEEFGSIENLFKEYDEKGEFDKKVNLLPQSLGRYKKKINTFCGSEELREKYYLNIKLMDLINVQLNSSDLKIVSSEPKLKAFKEFCEDLSFKSIVLQMHEWQRLFAIRKGTS